MVVDVACLFFYRKKKRWCTKPERENTQYREKEREREREKERERERVKG